MKFLKLFVLISLSINFILSQDKEDNEPSYRKIQMKRSNSTDAKKEHHKENNKAKQLKEEKISRDMKKIDKVINNEKHFKEDSTQLKITNNNNYQKQNPRYFKSIFTF